MLQTFEVDEVMTGNDSVIALTLGFRSSRSRVDAIHIVSFQADDNARRLHVERTDQTLACEDQVQELTCDNEGIRLRLTKEGARLLKLSPELRFTFRNRPDLLRLASKQIESFEQAGHALQNKS